MKLVEGGVSGRGERRTGVVARSCFKWATGGGDSRPPISASSPPFDVLPPQNQRHISRCPKSQNKATGAPNRSVVDWLAHGRPCRYKSDPPTHFPLHPSLPSPFHSPPSPSAPGILHAHPQPPFHLSPSPWPRHITTLTTLTTLITPGGLPAICITATTTMEFSMPPQSTAATPFMFAGHIQNTLHHFRCNRLHGALEGLLSLGDAMHGTGDDFGALEAWDLPQVNRLFSAIIHHSAYGVYQCADLVINRILVMAIERCEETREVQLHPARGRVGWQSWHHSEINEYLEFYRNFLSFITGHPASSLSRDHNLDSAQLSLQRLCPRINGLSRWAYREVRTARSGSTAQPCTPQLQPRGKKPPPPRLGKAPAPMPTPPTQSGDVRCADTLLVPTVPLKHPWKPNEARAPTPVFDVPSCTLGRDAIANGLVEDATQLWNPRPVSVHVREEERCPPKGKVAAEFKLRPEHLPSPRCCSSGVVRWDCRSSPCG